MEVTRLWFALILGSGSTGCLTREREVGEIRQALDPEPDVYISEVADDPSANQTRFVELCNPTGAARDLSSYQLKRYPDGNSPPLSVPLTGHSLPAGGTFVILKSAGWEEFRELHGFAEDLRNDTGAADGNDIIELWKDGAPIDVFGQAPGTSWHHAHASVEREFNATHGSTTFDFAGEWRRTPGPGTPGSHACGRNYAAVPASAQKRCFATPAGGLPSPEVPCGAGTTARQDAKLRTGIKYPNPRFEDPANGTITDTLTGLTWLKNANCFGESLPWAEALSRVANLAAGTNVCCSPSTPTLCLNDGSMAGSWRLPTVKELLSLVDYNYVGPALPNYSGTGQCQKNNEFCPFRFVEGHYWSSTSGVGLDKNTSGAAVKAWGVKVGGDGVATGKFKFEADGGVLKLFVWPVKVTSDTAGRPASVPSSGQQRCWRMPDVGTPWPLDAGLPPVACTDPVALGQNGAVVAGVPYPNPRFTVDGDTVIDHLTDLTWLRNTGCFDKKSWPEAMAAIKNGTTKPGCVLPSGDWRLPNIKELQSLIDYDTSLGTLSEPALPPGHFFRKTDGTGGVQYTSYWSSTTRALAADSDSTDFPNAWYLGLPSGVVHYNTNAANEDVDPDCEPDNCLDKRTLRGVWPVKGPRPIVSPPP